MAGAIKKTKTPRAVPAKKEMKPKKAVQNIEKEPEVNEIPLVEKKEEIAATSTEDLVQTLDSETYSSSDDGFDSSDNEAPEKEDGNEDEEKDTSDFVKNASIVALSGGSKSAQAVEKAMAKSKAMVSVSSNPGVVYLGRVPHGFYEEEMESYFAQFGQVCRLRLSRNKKVRFLII
jgi:nucleolar protein 15